jgi:threonine synthase
VRFRCTACASELPAAPEAWSCPSCGGPLDVTAPYEPARRVTLGEPVTPVVRLAWDGLDVTFKHEGALPTGSFKDRGASVLVSWLAEHGVRRAHDDSSGNAGAALAAYCARAGIACDVYVPADAPASKLRQTEAYGARTIPVEGGREAVTEAATAAAASGAVYASHAWSPVYLEGTRTFAAELWDQLGGRAPDVLVLPVGGGSLLLGAHRGFAVLGAVPRIVGVQPAACAPLARAIAEGSPRPVEVQGGRSVAGGALIRRPVRGEAILAAVRESGGTVVEVGDEATLAARARLGREGVYAEPTSALAVAALGAHRVAEPGERVAVALTGHGLKDP